MKSIYTLSEEIINLEFKDLGLSQRILDAVRDEGYVEPSPIQREAIPPALKGRDILGCAQTGTGKTAAFAMPIIQRLVETKSEFVSTQDIDKARAIRPIRALILSPTRELALQIFESFHSYGKYTNLRYGVIMGGVNQSGQVRVLNSGIDVLVATPGRLLDLLYQGHIEISAIEVFVLDEADRMLDMGFFDDVKRIIEIIPPKRQTMFFTATMPPEIKKLTQRLLIDPVVLAVSPVSSTVDTTTQIVYLTDKFKKQDLLIWYLKGLPRAVQALIFVRTKYGADKLTKRLVNADIYARAIHGDKSQEARQTALNSFKAGSLPILVATDIAARGIDIDSLPLVINFELPNVPETYVHRIGRTGRAGKEGAAVSFCDFEEKKYLTEIEKLIKKPITIIHDHPFSMEDFNPPKKVRTGRGSNPRSSDQNQSQGQGQRRGRRSSPRTPPSGNP